MTGGHLLHAWGFTEHKGEDFSGMVLNTSLLL